MQKTLLLFFMLSCSLLFSHNFSEKGDEPWGIDHELIHVKPTRQPELTTQKRGIAKRACAGSISFFQKYISAIDGPRSTFYPTSSEYAKQMIEKYGFLQGIALGCDRLLRENNDAWVYRTIEKHGILRKIDN